jgi:hypothetical protein
MEAEIQNATLLIYYLGNTTYHPAYCSLASVVFFAHHVPGASNPPHTPGQAARSLSGHDFLTQTPSSNGPRTLGLIGTPHI